MKDALIEKVAIEVTDLHQFFEDWFNGKLPEDQGSRFTSVMDDQFELITPSGTRMSREEIVQLVIGGYASNEGRKIWVEDTEVRKLGNLYLATYYELQSHKGNDSKRISTAVFREDTSAPLGCVWLHVHETWAE